MRELKGGSGGAIPIEYELRHANTNARDQAS